MTSNVKTRVEIMRDTQIECYNYFLTICFNFRLFIISIFFYFIAFISLPVVSFMNFSLMYSLFLYTFIISNLFTWWITCASLSVTIPLFPSLLYFNLPLRSLSFTFTLLSKSLPFHSLFIIFSYFALFLLT